MGQTIVEQIMAAHLVSGELAPGAEVALKIDHTLTQDATGTLAYLEFEAMGVERARPEVAVSYVDHNLLQTDFRNADDHRFLRSIAAKYGLYFSPPGNGISHQVHLERFSVPGKTMLGSDSHTPTAGGAGMLAFGAGGLDVALALAGQPFYLIMPEIIGVRLTGRFPAWVSAKDVILELLRRLTVKGGRGKILEFFGPALRCSQRAGARRHHQHGGGAGGHHLHLPGRRPDPAVYDHPGPRGGFPALEGPGPAPVCRNPGNQPG